MFSFEGMAFIYASLENVILYIFEKIKANCQVLNYKYHLIIYNQTKFMGAKLSLLKNDW